MSVWTLGTLLLDAAKAVLAEIGLTVSMSVWTLGTLLRDV